MSIHLSRRLQALADAVPYGARVIDVGTDHAMIPVWLAQTGRAAHVWASDIRPGPLESARRLICETDTESMVELRLTDGLQGFGPDDGNTVIIAGMGGETMVSILSAAPWTQRDTLLILEPQSKQALLRSWLTRNDYNIVREYLVKDAGRLYPVLVAQGGAPVEHTLAELHTGRISLIGQDPLLVEYLEGLIRRTASAAPYAPEAKELLAALEELKERLIPCTK